MKALHRLVQYRLRTQDFPFVQLVPGVLDRPFMCDQQDMGVVVRVLLLHWVSNNISYQYIQDQVNAFIGFGAAIGSFASSGVSNELFDLQLIQVYFCNDDTMLSHRKNLTLIKAQTFQKVRVYIGITYFHSFYNSYFTFEMGCALSNDAQLNSQLPQNRLQKLEMLGKGTHGQVYKSRDVVTNRDYALKIINNLPADMQKDLLNELISSRLPKLQQIIHPNLIHYEAVESKATEMKILMDVSPLGNLSKKISSEGRLPEGTVSFYTKQILEGLLQIHSNEFLHMDLKPTNVFLFDNDIVKLADYSIADIYDQRLRDVRAANQKLEHIKLNNIPYMAPEVVKNLGATTLSDVWSVGCIAVFMLTGKRPWSDLGSENQLFKKVTKSSIPPLPFGITVACEHFLECCLQVVPSQRSKLQELLDHPFIVGSSNYQINIQPQEKIVNVQDIQSIKLTPEHISLKVIEKAEKNKCLKTESSENNKEYLQYLNAQDKKDCNGKLFTEQTPASDRKSIKAVQNNHKIPKRRQNVFVQSTKRSNHQDHYVMLNNRKVKFKTSFYKNRRQHVLSTEETEWTSPSRARVKAVKELRGKQSPVKEHSMKFQPSLGIHSVLSRQHQGEPVFQNRLRIDTQPGEYNGEDYFKRPLKLLKKKLQQKKQQALFQEQMSNATRKLSLMIQADKLNLIDVEKQGSDCSPSRLKNYEQFVIDTEVARAQRNRYKEVKEQTQKMREIRRLRWEFELNKGRELLKTQVPFSFYIQ